MYWLANHLFNPILRTILRSPFRSLLPDNWVILTYTGRKTHKKRSLVFHVAQYKDEFIVVPGCFGELPNWWRNFRKESKVDLFYKGKSMECLARAVNTMKQMRCLGSLRMYEFLMLAQWELRLKQRKKSSMSW